MRLRYTNLPCISASGRQLYGRTNQVGHYIPSRIHRQQCARQSWSRPRLESTRKMVISNTYKRERSSFLPSLTLVADWMRLITRIAGQILLSLHCGLNDGILASLDPLDQRMICLSIHPGESDIYNWLEKGRFKPSLDQIWYRQWPQNIWNKSKWGGRRKLGPLDSWYQKLVTALRAVNYSVRTL